MQKLKTVLLFVLFSNAIFGQTNYDTFKKLFKEKDTVQIATLLKKWEKTNANDPELYTSAFNFYFHNSKMEVLSLQTEKPTTESFQLKDSLENMAGYLTSGNPGYNTEKLNKAFKYITTGIEKFPNRLDLRFGKSYALGEIGDYENFTKEILKTVEYSTVNKNKWLWTENAKKEDAEDFMIGAIQSYLVQLYNTEDDRLLANMLKIGELTLKHYPNKVQILSTTAIVNMLYNNYDKALDYLKRAEQINPKDLIVLNNIAQAYKRKGDKTNAIKYFELVDKYGDTQDKEAARKGIMELKK